MKKERELKLVQNKRKRKAERRSQRGKIDKDKFTNNASKSSKTYILTIIINNIVV